MNQAMTFRLDDELAERLRAHSDESGVPQAQIVKRALERWFSDREPKVWGESAPGVVGPMPSGKPAAANEPRPYRCPMPGCKREAGSPNAVCGIHGRKVVPVT